MAYHLRFCENLPVERIQFIVGHGIHRLFDHFWRNVVVSSVNHEASIREGGLILDVAVLHHDQTVASVLVVDQLAQSFQGVPSSVVGFRVNLNKYEEKNCDLNRSIYVFYEKIKEMWIGFDEFAYF